ncbi:hypothetical protein V7094_25540 [Priestia megaterium]|uniref:hypothetical protein n=1 Tax=Priestia megaterium TaxID=1404 RepID=UPI002FFE2EB1
MAFSIKNTEAMFKEKGLEQLRVSVADHKTLANVFKLYRQADGEDWRQVFAYELINLRPTEMREDIQGLRKRFTFDQLMRIACGEKFEIVPTPEEKLVERYKDLHNSNRLTDQAIATGMRQALNILDIKVEGVNASEDNWLAELGLDD